MPPHKAVSPLTESTLRAAFSWLLRCGRCWTGIKARQLQRAYVFSVVSPPIRQQLLAAAMASNMYELCMDGKIIMLELLGDASTKAIDLTKTGYQYVDEIFSFYRAVTFSLVVNLTTFGIVCLVKGSMDLKYVKEINGIFYRTMEHMKHLTSITMRGLGDTELLSTIGQTCQHLEYLDVSQSLLIDDESIAALLANNPDSLLSLWEGKTDRFIARRHMCCLTLRFLGITETEISTQVVCSLLQLLPCIESFGGYLHHGSMCHAITYLYGEKGHIKQDKIFRLDLYSIRETGSYQFCVGDPDDEDVAQLDSGEVVSQGGDDDDDDDDESDGDSDLITLPSELVLTHLWDIQISAKQSEVLSRVCPRLVAIDTNLASLESLCNFLSLTSLSVDCDFKAWHDMLWWFLENFGTNLRSVVVRDAIEDFLPFDHLSEWCPQLTSLTLPLNISGSDVASVSPWESLTYVNTSVPSTKVLTLLCESAVNLKELYVAFSPAPYTETRADFNDALVMQLVSSGSLESIDTLVLGRCGVSHKGLEALCRNCPNLRRLGYVDLWSAVTLEHLSRVKQLIRDNNWDLTLVHATDFPGDQLHFAWK